MESVEEKNDIHRRNDKERRAGCSIDQNPREFIRMLSVVSGVEVGPKASGLLKRARNATTSDRKFVLGRASTSLKGVSLLDPRCCSFVTLVSFRDTRIPASLVSATRYTLFVRRDEFINSANGTVDGIKVLRGLPRTIRWKRSIRIRVSGPRSANTVSSDPLDIAR